MQFNVSPIPTYNEAPEYFKRFLQHYLQVIKYLQQLSNNNLILDENLKGGTFFVSATHNSPTVIRHNLNSAPSIVCAVGGRYQAYIVEKIDSESVIVRFKLLQCTIKEVNSNELTVDSSALFVKDDKILINGERRRISSVFGNTIVIDNFVDCSAGDIVLLNGDGIALAIY